MVADMCKGPREIGGAILRVSLIASVYGLNRSREASQDMYDDDRRGPNKFRIEEAARS